MRTDARILVAAVLTVMSIRLGAEPVRVAVARIPSVEELSRSEMTIGKWMVMEESVAMGLVQGLKSSAKVRALGPMREKAPMVFASFIDSEVHAKYAGSRWLNVQMAVVGATTWSREYYLREFSGAVETNGLVRLDNPQGRVGNDEYLYVAFSPDGKWSAVGVSPEMASAALDEVPGSDETGGASVSVEIHSAGLKMLGAEYEQLEDCAGRFSRVKMNLCAETGGLVIEGECKPIAGHACKSDGGVSPEEAALAFAPANAIFAEARVLDGMPLLLGLVEYDEAVGKMLKDAGLDLSLVKFRKGPSGRCDIEVGLPFVIRYLETLGGWFGAEPDADLCAKLHERVRSTAERGAAANLSYSITVDGCVASAPPAERIAALLPAGGVDRLRSVSYGSFFPLLKAMLHEKISHEQDSLRAAIMPLLEQLPASGDGFAVKSWCQGDALAWRARISATEIKGLFLAFQAYAALMQGKAEERARQETVEHKENPVEEAERLVGCGDLTGALTALERAPTNDWAMCSAVGDFYGTHETLPTNRAERLHCWMDRAYQMADAGRKCMVASRCASGLCLRRYGYPVDWPRARLWLHRAADSGSAYWQCMLAYAYVEGLYGIRPDEKKALYYLELAEKQKHVKTHHVRATMYEKGFGLPRDYKKALECLELGMKRGSGLCPRVYAVMLIRGRGGDGRRAEGFAMLRKLVSQGVEDPGYCLSVLGEACEYGHGVEKDLNLAIEFYRQSAALKNDFSIRRLKALNVKWPDE